MSARHLFVLFALFPVAVVGQNRNVLNSPSIHYAALQPPTQPATEPAPESNPTAQPPQPAAEPAPEPNPATAPQQPLAQPTPEPNPSATQPAPQQPPAPVVRIERKPAPTDDADSESAKKNTDTESGQKKDDGEKKDDNDRPVNAAELHNATLWHDPGDIASLDLLYGQGGRKGMPVAPFTFESEDHHGTNPKFDARDANGKKWRVKLGEEARPEVVASRLLWATGYYVNDDYVLTDAEIQGIHLSRGGNLVKHGRISEARFARKPGGQKKIGIWKWKENPFTGTREFNGLRVMMAVMNNWDLKDDNNAVFEDSRNHQDLFLTSDVGATFGTNGLSWTHARSKGNVESFKGSKFIEKTTATTVSFGTPKPPTARLIETFGIGGAKDYIDRAGMDWIGKDIPRQDARWVGSLLKQLSHQQLVDAFRAGHFPPEDIDAYVELVESRIQELSSL
ncbi:MAG TPA: hypothetical protein VGH38_18250 [Bryobacteraceae bacterium]